MALDEKRNDLLRDLLVELLIFEAHLSKITKIEEVDNDSN